MLLQHIWTQPVVHTYMYVYIGTLYVLYSHGKIFTVRCMCDMLREKKACTTHRLLSEEEEKRK